MAYYLVAIDSIKEVRLGKTTERLREHTQQFENESLFSIIYTNDHQDYTTLDLVASSVDEANIWVTGLSCLIAGNGTPPTSAGTIESLFLSELCLIRCILFLFIDLEHRQQTRDRWLRDAFAGGLTPPTSEVEQVNHTEDQTLTNKNSIDEEEAVRLLSDHGIAEDKAKIRLQVRSSLL